MKDIFDRMRAGEVIPFDDPEYPKLFVGVTKTLKLLRVLNASSDIGEMRELLGEIIEQNLDETTSVLAPFNTNYGRFITLGKNVFINHDCTFLDLGGITIDDDVLIAPKACLVTEDHPLDPAKRKALVVRPIHIKRNAWIGATATILPGVTVGENSVVAAGSLVNKDVPDNVVVGGNPAKILKEI